jgi:hypothetical protein
MGENETLEKLYIIEGYPIDFNELFDRKDSTIDKLLSARGNLTPEEKQKLVNRYKSSLELEVDYKDTSYEVFTSLLSGPNSQMFVSYVFSLIGSSSWYKQFGLNVDASLMESKIVDFFFANGDNEVKANLKKTLLPHQIEPLLKRGIVNSSYVIDAIQIRIKSNMKESELLSLLELAYKYGASSNTVESLENKIADKLSPHLLAI